MRPSRDRCCECGKPTSSTLGTEHFRFCSEHCFIEAAKEFEKPYPEGNEKWVSWTPTDNWATHRLMTRLQSEEDLLKRTADAKQHERDSAEAEKRQQQFDRDYLKAHGEHEAFMADEQQRKAEEERWRPRDFIRDWNRKDEARFTGHWICSPSGKGKTTLLHNMLLHDLAPGEQDCCVILMDCKGEMLDPFRNIIHPDHLVPRAKFRDELNTSVIRIDRDHLPAINPLDVPKDDPHQALTFLNYIFGTLMRANVTPKQEVLFGSVLRALIMGWPRPTLATMWDLISNGPDKHREHIDTLPEDLRTFFYKEWKDYDATRGELKWRLRLLNEDDIIKTMFSSSVTKFDIGSFMDSDCIVLIDIPQGLLGQQRSEMLGRFFIAQIWQAAVRRSLRPKGAYKHPVFFYIDEAAVVIREDRMIANILDYCRSEKIGIILAHQRASQIEDQNVLSALTNCGIRMTNSDEEARYFSKHVRVPEDRIENLKRGQFAMFIRDKGGCIVQTSLVDFSGGFQQMSPMHAKALENWTREQYGITREAPKMEASRSLQGEPEKADPINISQTSITPVIPATPSSDPSKPAKNFNPRIKPRGQS